MTSHRRPAVSENARNSILAWAPVLLLAGFFYAVLPVLRDLEIPRWLVWTSLSLTGLQGVLLVSRCRSEKQADLSAFHPFLPLPFAMVDD
jgi:hypothetical protein